MIYSPVIAAELGIQEWQAANTIEMIESGATVPFMARYRKELTGSLDEVMIAAIRDRLAQLRETDKRREAVIASIREQEKLTEELHSQLMEAKTITEIEDLYLPYRPKRKTRATQARARGLEPLALWLLSQKNGDVTSEASIYIDEEKGVADSGDALAGARDIIAEIVSEDASLRQSLRNLFTREAVLCCKVSKGKEQEGFKYESWFDWKEPLMKAPSHRILAMFRGEAEGFLGLRVAPDEETAVAICEKKYVRSKNEAAEQVREAVKDAYKRLIQPSLETEMRNMAKDKADHEAIRVFAANLRQLMLSPPLGQKNVLAIDPGFRTGCKVVCLDRQGRLLHNETIYPHPPASETKQAVNKILSLVDAYKIEAIAIGNGTAGRETESFIKRIRFPRDLIAVMVNESGASVYSASPVAREEFPEYDVTVRGAVSIGRRLMDPLAELVKIDPRSIGVGQYQHDVNQTLLQSGLEEVVESCVNGVGVELNTASKQLLTYVSGLGPVLAKNIVDYRNANGPFKKRSELKKVPRFGEKAFEQAAGFLRIHGAENPLDATAVHPESYDIVKRMASDMKCGIEDLINDENKRAAIKPELYVTGQAGLPTLLDIMAELSRPGRDPRSKFAEFEFDQSVHKIEDLVPGMVLPGIVTNITAFGAFVDVGVHQDGLVHVSQLADRFVSDPSEVVKLNQKVTVKVLEVDVRRKRISLTMKGTG